MYLPPTLPDAIPEVGVDEAASLGRCGTGVVGRIHPDPFYEEVRGDLHGSDGPEVGVEESGLRHDNLGNRPTLRTLRFWKLSFPSLLTMQLTKSSKWR